MYTYRFADILTDRDLAELDVGSVRFDRRIIVPGSFSGSIEVSNSSVARQVKNIVPGKTLVHVYRNNVIWGTYIIWTVRIAKQSRGPTTVEINGASLESWMYRRLVDEDMQFTQEDQIDIARELLSVAQAGWSPYEDNANLGIEVQDGTTDILRDRTYLKAEAATVGQRIEELANVDNGFEYFIDVHVDIDAGIRRRVFKWGYPEMGEQSNLWSYQMPGNILGFELTYDAIEGATAFWARGDSIDDDVTGESVPLMTEEPVFAEDFLDRGFIHLDRVVDYSGVLEVSTLDSYAQWWMQNRGGVVLIPSLEVRADDNDNQMFTPGRLGEFASIAIENEYFPLQEDGSPGYTGNFRVVGIEVTPDSRGQIETHRLVISQDFDPTEIE